ncbi:redox-sensing transcriptional repressor Rex [candidate division KSB3 bacterium]|uniref:Redox-sensing transcriptional repressor Rex n=1 Tax=candidate division KSB3 bacterium TaxID=2044937 RepID=A0A2G6E4A0_9BACT|nr:MAG: redox-sensing transcriptional repressor Rex [candidate division KSB3 bacterium]PIE29428.1 MAG: redox-sensing transcriptional repressor Rex [candidate division KSB3 bacterium]
MKHTGHISEFTIYRLSVYKRCLEQLEREQLTTISSKDFANRFGLNSAQVRKDLACFGEFGIRGMGYPISTLREQIATILGFAKNSNGPQKWTAVLIGAGRLGSALLTSQQFFAHGFEIHAAFDLLPDSSDYRRQADAKLLDKEIPLYPVEKLEDVLKKMPTDIAILAVSEADAQDLADRVTALGIRAILNFVPVQLLVPPDVKVRTVDLAAELQCLTYHLHNSHSESEDGERPMPAADA